MNDRNYIALLAASLLFCCGCGSVGVRDVSSSPYFEKHTDFCPGKTLEFSGPAIVSKRQGRPVANNEILSKYVNAEIRIPTAAISDHVDPNLVVDFNQPFTIEIPSNSRYTIRIDRWIAYSAPLLGTHVIPIGTVSYDQYVIRNVLLERVFGLARRVPASELGISGVETARIMDQLGDQAQLLLIKSLPQTPP